MCQGEAQARRGPAEENPRFHQIERLTMRGRHGRRIKTEEIQVLKEKVDIQSLALKKSCN